MSLSVVHEDGELIAVDKPAGRVVIPGRGADEGEPLAASVSRHCGRRVYVVHRIDRETSGLVVFARNAAAHRRLCGLFAGRNVEKEYLAVVAGRVARNGSVARPIRQFGSGRMGVAANGKPSLTRYRVLRRLDGATLLEVRPRTGRRHQIRVHLYAIGHPVLGDRLYGNDRPVGGAARLMLHARRLVLAGSGEPPLVLEAPIPPEFPPLAEGEEVQGLKG